MFSNSVTLEEVAQHWVRKSTFILEKGMEYRNHHPEAKFLDIQYENLVKDSMSIMEKIYRDSGGISDDLRQRFLSTEKENPPRKYGSHKYSLEDFGLTEADIEDKLPLYNEFKVPNSKKQNPKPKTQDPEPRT
jgi:hypothetical protein